MRNKSVAKLFFSIDSSYVGLKEIRFSEITIDVLIQLLHQYSGLPRLLSLDIDISDRIKYKQTIQIYQMVFARSKLKSFRFAVSIHGELFAVLPLTLASKEQYTRIEYLHLDHCMDLNELFRILSYTPKLIQLTVSFIIDNKNRNVELEHQIQILLTNLKYFSIEHYEADFDELEEFFSRINCRLKIFRLLIMHRQGNRHSVYQWQRFIRKYLWDLKDFNLIFRESKNSQSEILYDTIQFKEISSTFWIQIPMNFELEISSSDIKHTIIPYQYEYTKVNSPMKLCLTKLDLEESFSLVISHIHQILPVTRIEHVQIEKISIDTLMKILKLIPQLNSIQISSLLINRTDTIETNQNQITKVSFGKLKSSKQIDLLLKIFPHIIYFRLNSTKNINIQVYLRYILNKIKTISNNQLQFLSFHDSTATDRTIEILKMMIQSEKLLFNYKIQRIFNDIYVGWGSSHPIPRCSTSRNQFRLQNQFPPIPEFLPISFNSAQFRNW